MPPGNVGNGPRQELGGDCPSTQALPLSGPGRGVPYRRLQGAANTPPDEQGDRARLRPPPVAATRGETEQQRPPPLLPWARRAPGLAVQRRALGGAVTQDRVDRATDRRVGIAAACSPTPPLSAAGRPPLWQRPAARAPVPKAGILFHYGDRKRIDVFTGMGTVGTGAPSWPELLSPQQCTSPVVVTAQL